MNVHRANERSPDWAKLLLRPPLVVAGVLSAITATHAARRAARRIAGGDRSVGAIDRFRAAFTGAHPQLVRRVLGEPRAFSANAWYFPLDLEEKLLIAVEFDEAHARHIHLVRAPVLADHA